MRLICEEQGLLTAEFCGGDPVWMRPMTVSGLLLQPPCFLPSPGTGLPRDLNITDTNYATRISSLQESHFSYAKNSRTAQIGRNLERSSGQTFHTKGA